MPLPLDQLMHELATYLRTPLDVVRDVYTLTVPLPGTRFQVVSATIRPDHEGHQLIDFVSGVGQVYQGLDPWYLLAMNDKTMFCRVAVVRQMIFVVASQLLDTAQPQEVLIMLREVATTADRLEEQLFARDEN